MPAPVSLPLQDAADLDVGDAQDPERDTAEQVGAHAGEVASPQAEGSRLFRRPVKIKPMSLAATFDLFSEDSE